jgi:murein DD-endopeptidase MepM/ murein hydrolase activator NlpD
VLWSEDGAKRDVYPFWFALFAIVLTSWLMARLWMASPAKAAPSAQVIVVGPDDISTPTPTPLPGLLPTVTPAQASTSDGVSPITGGLYIVQPEDTLWSVALEMGVDLEQMGCVVGPAFAPEKPLVIGDRLEALPPGFACHQVQPGETLAAIADEYHVTAEQIAGLAWNRQAGQRLEPDALKPGLYLRIPPSSSDTAAASGFLGILLDQPVDSSPFLAYAVGGPLPAPAPVAVPDNWPYGSGSFIWPATGWLSQGYRNDHRAVDIAAAPGIFVMAADRGVVIRAGWNDQGYGQFVVIDHNIDYVTLYAHLDEIYVQEGDVVAQGQIIGTVGSTGNSTGPHLHFEIRDFGQRTNPLGLLLR